jgi:predicted SAM-dependent methyltransferase
MLEGRPRPREAPKSIEVYLAERHAAATKGLPRGPAARFVRRISSPGIRASAKVNGTILLAPLARRKVRELLREGRPVLLNLGSGPQRAAGWVNVDILGMNPDLYWDLRRGIPFPDASVQATFLEHVLEHFATADALRILKECRRVLVPGGVVRVGVPDFGLYMRSYAADGEAIEQLRPGRPTPLLAVAEVALQHGHRSVWDAVTLERALEEAGFTDVSARPFGESSLDPVPDTKLREPESVYAEGTKPAG